MIISYNKKINRKVRVFISSTFSDMECERDIIVHSVFPRLRQEFSSQMIDITEVDLRWRYPEEDFENSKILEICIGEVLHCYPFFVGIVGQQYGQPASMDAIAKLPPAYRKAIGQDLSEGTSITELEMRAGVFIRNNVDFSSFFIKTNIERAKISPRLKQLVENICASYTTYTYDTPASFENQIFNSLKECILKAIPEKLDDPYKDKYYYSHLRILKNNAHRYIANTLFVQDAERRLKEQRRIYLKGEKGIGKSACISWLAKQEGIDRTGDVFFHFAAAGNESLNIDNAFFRLRLYLQSIMDYKGSETDNRAIVTELLSMLPTERKVTLYFDAMDQLNDITAIYQFFALADINQNIFVVCSGTENYVGISKEQSIEVDGLTPDQINQILTQSLNQFGKKLTSKMREQIIRKESCSNPLFLRAFITQLRMYGAFDTFEKFFEQLIAADSFKDIFLIVIERLKTYFAKYSMSDSSVDKALAMLVYSKKGIRESELQEILNFIPVTRSVFLSAIELFTIEENGLIRFNHDLIIQTTKEILDKTGMDYERVVAEIYVEYFFDQPLDWRRYSEETFQLCKLDRVAELAQCLTNIDCFMYLRRHEYHSLIGYLSRLLNQQFTLIDILTPQLDNQEKIAMADIFCQAGCHRAVISLAETQLAKENTSICRIQLLDILARSQYKLGLNHLEKSINTYRDLLSYYKETFPEDEIGYASRAYLLGVAYKTSGKIDRANEILESCADIYERHNISTSTSVWIMDVYGESCYGAGKLKKALEIVDKVVITCTKLFGKFSTELAWAYCYGWNTLYALGQRTQALEMLWSAYAIYKQLYFGRGTKFAWAALNAGTAALVDGDNDKAEELYKFAIEENDIIIPEKDRPHAYSITIYANLANLYEYTGKHKNAVKTISFALDQSSKKNGAQHIYTANILLNMGILMCDYTKIKRAIKLYESQSFQTPDVYFARMCLARILLKTGKEDAAITEINTCASEYFSEDRETELISYLILDTLDKVRGNMSDDMLNDLENLYRYDDYKFYLTHNNNSNIIIIPSI